MRMGEVRKGARVRLSDKARALHTLPDEIAATLGRSMLIMRVEGTVRSPRPVALRRPYEEGLVAYVIWDGLRTPEAWHLVDLELSSTGPGAAG
jgi:hypothetical protein